MALEAILEPLGERLLRASSGAEAVAIAAEEDLALVLLDLQMPELDGLETAARLRKTPRARSVPVIILTASEPTRAEVAKGYASGAVDFLRKPLDADFLRSKVSAFVDLYKERVAAEQSSEDRSREEPGDRVSERLLAAQPAEAARRTVQALVRLYTVLGDDLDPGRIAQRLVDEARDLTHATGGAFHHRVRGGAMSVALSGGFEGELLALGPSSSLVAPAFEGEGPVRFADLRQAAGDAPMTLRSLLAVPVVAANGDVDGALVLVSDEAHAFDVRDEELATVAAHYAAVARDNARLFEAASDAKDRAELAELELRAQQARSRLALEAGGLGTWDFNPGTGVLRWDARSKALAGLGPDADIDVARFLGGIHPDDRDRVASAITAALDPSSLETFDVEYRAIGIEDGVERWLASKGQTIVEQGRTVRFIGIVLDCTVKKRVEEERATLLASETQARADAESASRAKDEFLATVSHELRNPLNAILGWSRVLIEERDVDPERMKKGLEVIARNAKAQVQLVEDILEVSRIVTGKLRLTTGPVDVRSVVDTALETVRSAAQAKAVLLDSRFEGDPGLIVADEDRVQQILWNLLSNAVKFTPSGGRVHITVRRDASAVLFAVEDSGEGIEPSFLPYVFDRFRQADGSTTRAHGGLGLGLAIVRHLVELHGGTAHAQSPGRGRGATFTVRLPLRAGDTEGQTPAKITASKPEVVPQKPVSPLAGRRVVVLDDEADMRDLIAMILEHAGAEVVRMTSVDAAYRYIEAGPPDVAVSDLAMPIEDGYAFVKRVRQSAILEVRRTPLVAMTAYARAEDRHRVLSAGFDRHVAKPIEPAELVDVLSELVLEVARRA